MIVKYCDMSRNNRLETYLIPGETLIPGGKGKRGSVNIGMTLGAFLDVLV